MTKLIPLSQIPYAARGYERTARAAYPTRSAALYAANYRIDVAPGCHSRPYFDPPVIGKVLTRAAAQAICGRLTYMPGNTSHQRATCDELARIFPGDFL
jgi:hypothetical protein